MAEYLMDYLYGELDNRTVNGISWRRYSVLPPATWENYLEIAILDEQGKDPVAYYCSKMDENTYKWIKIDWKKVIRDLEELFEDTTLIHSELDTKQHNLTPGANINIKNNVISASSSIGHDFEKLVGSPYDNAALAVALNLKQNNLTAGEHIAINSENVISAYMNFKDIIGIPVENDELRKLINAIYEHGDQLRLFVIQQDSELSHRIDLTNSELYLTDKKINYRIDSEVSELETLIIQEKNDRVKKISRVDQRIDDLSAEAILIHDSLIKDINSEALKREELQKLMEDTFTSEENKFRWIIQDAYDYFENRISSETEDRQNADEELRSHFNSEIERLTGYDSELLSLINSEAFLRVEADNELTLRLESEITTRTSEGENLYRLITSEGILRAEGDDALNTKFGNWYTAISSALNSEIIIRGDSDNELNELILSLVNSERIERIASDSELLSTIELNKIELNSEIIKISNKENTDVTNLTTKIQEINTQITNINSELVLKQDRLTAGENITISEGLSGELVISAVGGDGRVKDVKVKRGSIEESVVGPDGIAVINLNSEGGAGIVGITLNGAPVTVTDGIANLEKVVVKDSGNNVLIEGALTSNNTLSSNSRVESPSLAIGTVSTKVLEANTDGVGVHKLSNFPVSLVINKLPDVVSEGDNRVYTQDGLLHINLHFPTIWSGTDEPDSTRIRATEGDIYIQYEE